MNDHICLCNLAFIINISAKTERINVNIGKSKDKIKIKEELSEFTLVIFYQACFSNTLIYIFSNVYENQIIDNEDSKCYI